MRAVSGRSVQGNAEDEHATGGLVSIDPMLHSVAAGPALIAEQIDALYREHHERLVRLAACPIGIQWDATTNISMVWGAPSGHRLPGEDEESLLELVSGLRVNPDSFEAGPLMPTS